MNKIRFRDKDTKELLEEITTVMHFSKHSLEYHLMPKYTKTRFIISGDHAVVYTNKHTIEQVKSRLDTLVHPERYKFE